jgi:glycerophosphoryl diester phosphodiesterase
MDLHRPLIIAHRGGALLAGENSAAAFHAAGAAGADVVETDVRRSADGALVCIHDDDLMRLANDPRKVADLDLLTLRRLVPGLMTLAEAIDASTPLGLLLDVKLRDVDILSPITAAVERSGAAERVIFGLRDLALIAELRRLNAGLAILAFLDDPDIVTSAAAAGAHWFRLWQGEVTEDRIAMVRQAGLRLAVMTGQPRNVPIEGEWPPFSVGQIDGAGLAQLLSLRPDAILLDDPHLVSSV